MRHVTSTRTVTRKGRKSAEGVEWLHTSISAFVNYQSEVQVSLMRI